MYSLTGNDGKEVDAGERLKKNEEPRGEESKLLLSGGSWDREFAAAIGIQEECATSRWM